jgi:ABC-type phosphate/phosphonate transport system substrate-binding protein
MYDLPELRSANDLLWATLAEHLAAEGVEAPAALTRGRPLEGVWRDPALLLAQTCGYPMMAELRGSVQLVATPCYLAEGCQGPFYRSAIVVAAGASAQTLEDLRGSRCAVNELSSNSGMNLLRAEISAIAGGREFFGHIRLTGAHAASLEVVACGEADVAAIDCVTYAHLRRLRPHLAQEVRVLAWTQPSPGLPLITSIATSTGSLAALRRALDAAQQDRRLEAARRDLLLDGFELVSEAQYGLVLDLRRLAVERGYPELR